MHRILSSGRVIVIALVGLVLVFGLSACGGDDGTEADEPDPTEPADEGTDVAGRSVILLTVTEECEYCAIHLRAFRERAEEAGLNLDVVINDFDAAQQAQQVNQALAQNPDAIVLWPADQNAIVPSLRRINDAGIPLVITNSLPPEEHEDLWDVYTGPNDITNGEQAARGFLQGVEQKDLGDEGNVFVITGVPGTPPAIQRLEGFRRVLEEEGPGIQIVGTAPGNWDQTEATNAAAGLFTAHGGPNLLGVYAQADNMLAGVITAARQRNIDPSSIVLVGSNCSIEGVQNIEAGDQYATVLQSPVDDGRYAAQAVIDLLAGEDPEDTQFLPNPVVTQENLDECDEAVGR